MRGSIERQYLKMWPFKNASGEWCSQDIKWRRVSRSASHGNVFFSSVEKVSLEFRSSKNILRNASLKNTTLESYPFWLTYIYGSHVHVVYCCIYIGFVSSGKNVCVLKLLATLGRIMPCVVHMFVLLLQTYNTIHTMDAGGLHGKLGMFDKVLSVIWNKFLIITLVLLAAWTHVCMVKKAKSSITNSDEAWRQRLLSDELYQTF